MLLFSDILKAEKRIRNFIRKTPLEYSYYYSDKMNGDVYLKLENQQVTGAFKIRGALNKILTLDDKDVEKGVVAASSGNHALGVAYASKMKGIRSTIVVPKITPKIKINNIKRYGANLILYGKYYDEAEKKAKEIAEKKGLIYISPYNDPYIIAGQGTIGLEIYEENADIDTVISPVGSGGLISGIAVAAKRINPNVRVIGVQSAASPIFYRSFEVGRIFGIDEVELHESIAEGLYGGLEKNSMTFDIAREYVDEILLVEENEIKDTIRSLIDHHHQIVEGSGAVGPAALVKYKDKFKGRKVSVVISGGNIDIDLLRQIICNRF